jgi:2'-5' RNA ligase superfamily
MRSGGYRSLPRGYTIFFVSATSHRDLNLGAGLAYKIDSPDLHSLHGQLRTHFLEVLTLQDRQPYRPHVTIMNKSTLENARTLLKLLSEDFQPFTVRGVGLDVWTYLGGPWRLARSLAF